MGKVIICTGNTAKQPYLFKKTGKRVYTMEELCYYIYHNVESISDELYDSELVNFIRNELLLPQRADFIQELIEKKAGIKDVVVSILCSADYYDKAQINQLLLEIDEFYRLSPVQRKKRQADYCLKHNQFKEAMREYRNIINGKEFSQLSSEEYGNILHNMAVIETKIGAFATAAPKFLDAYERNGNTDSLLQYLYAVKLAKQEDTFERETRFYVGTRELQKEMEDQLFHLAQKSQYTSLYAEFLRITELKEQGKMKEYYLYVDELLERLKTRYRKMSF